jgi:hypothetical protein
VGTKEEQLGITLYALQVAQSLMFSSLKLELERWLSSVFGAMLC